MNIEALLARDFATLTSRLEADDFAERTLARLSGVHRLRLAAIGGAGAAGAAIAATQFDALAEAISGALPMLASVSVGGEEVATGLSPLLMAAMVFAIVGAMTALVAPDAR